MTSTSVTDLIKWTVQSAHRTRNAAALLRVVLAGAAVLGGELAVAVSSAPAGTALAVGAAAPAAAVWRWARPGGARGPRAASPDRDEESGG